MSRRPTSRIALATGGLALLCPLAIFLYRADQPLVGMSGVTAPMIGDTLSVLALVLGLGLAIAFGERGKLARG